MDKLGSLLAFVRTAHARSFVAAARQLGVSSSAVGKSVARLEQQLGVRLLQRNTRNVQLTEEGRQFYERCKPLLDELEDAEAALTHAMQAPRGRLRIALPTVGYRFLVPVLGEFHKRYPEVELELDFNDQIVDVIDGGFDAAIRSGDMPDSRLRARRLGPFCFMLCAAPEYLACRGEPRVPADLAGHDCIHFRFANSGKLQEWSLKLEPGEAAPHLPAALVCNNSEAAVEAAVHGLGIVYSVDFLVREHLAAGRLQRVLPGYETQRGQFWALWPAHRHVSPKLRVFLDFIGERLFRHKPIA
ncbi:LysR family transcriptional regulator [Lysobacter enzymogenes]|uniref:LysR family transcriptional regulator n=1 Tax=Lysobacter enzymogenes TaxID=69 RepID=UPI001A973E50|nr:LysR family transcriptional regulator [Lysobacter enzymogenes]QQP94832.1 LysR family transcriptional regulator [Lysobacter enzymogenes]